MDNELTRKLKARRAALDLDATCCSESSDSRGQHNSKQSSEDASSSDVKELLGSGTVSQRIHALSASEQPKVSAAASPAGKDSGFRKEVQEFCKALDSGGKDVKDQSPLADLRPTRSSLPCRIQNVAMSDGSDLRAARPSLPCRTHNVATSDGSELTKRLQARRGVVDSEGNIFEKLAEASVADAHIGRGQKSLTPQKLFDDMRPDDLPSLPSFWSKQLEAALKKNLALRLDPYTEALAECLVSGEALPWEVLRRGGRTWVCDAWISTPLSSPIDEGRHGSPNGCTDPGPASVLPTILSLASDGELRCCMSVPAPPGVSEEADYVRLLGSFQATSLQKVYAPPSMSDVLCLHFSKIACIPPRSQVRDVAVGNSTGLAHDAADDALCTLPSLVAQFESEGEAQSCADALQSFAAVPVSDEVHAGAQDFAHMFGPIKTESATNSPEIKMPPPEMEAAERDCGISAWRAAALSSENLKAFMTQTQAFLQELDELAGFACVKEKVSGRWI